MNDISQSAPEDQKVCVMLKADCCLSYRCICFCALRREVDVTERQPSSLCPFCNNETYIYSPCRKKLRNFLISGKRAKPSHLRCSNPSDRALARLPKLVCYIIFTKRIASIWQSAAFALQLPSNHMSSYRNLHNSSW